MSPFEIFAGVAVLLTLGIALRRRKKRRIRGLLEPVGRERGGMVRSPIGGMPSIRFEHGGIGATLAFRRRGSPSSEQSGRHFRLKLPLADPPDGRLYIRRRPTRRTLHGVAEIPVSGGRVGERFRVHADDPVFTQEALTVDLRERLAAFPRRLDVEIDDGEITVEWSANVVPRESGELDRQLESALRIVDELLAALKGREAGAPRARR